MEALIKEMYGSDYDDEADDEDQPPGFYAPPAPVRSSVVGSSSNSSRRSGSGGGSGVVFSGQGERECFDFQDEVTDSSLRCIITARDIRRLQRFAHLTMLNGMTTSVVAGEMYNLTDTNNQITLNNYTQWVEVYVDNHLSLPGEMKWVSGWCGATIFISIVLIFLLLLFDLHMIQVKDCFMSLFSILDRDHLQCVELSDVIAAMTVFTQCSPSPIDKFQLAFQLYGTFTTCRSLSIVVSTSERSEL